MYVWNTVMLLRLILLRSVAFSDSRLLVVQSLDMYGNTFPSIPLEYTPCISLSFYPCSRSNQRKKRKNHQLKFFLPFALRLARIFLPSAVLLRDRNPCRRFCTRREGLYVHLFCPRVLVVEKGVFCCRLDDVVAFMDVEQA